MTDTGQGAHYWGSPTADPVTTLLLRHGQTALSTERRFAGRGDIPLTPDGRRQAKMAARALARGRLDVIVSSPLLRARQTAETVAAVTGATLSIEECLTEADFGAWEGLTFAEAQQRWPDELASWMTNPDAAPPAGESFATVARRVLAGLDSILSGHQGDTMLFVSHVTPIKTLICRALLAPPATLFRMNIDVASLSHVDWFEDGPALVRTLNDTSHLHRRTR